MQIVCISDTHNKHSQIEYLPFADMVVHAGDISVHGSAREIQDFMLWFASLPYKYKIFVAGNHDFAFETASNLLEIPQGVIYLQNKSIEIEGITIWGSPLCPPFYNWAFMWRTELREEAYVSIPNNCNIVINHSPPFKILDKTIHEQNVGCEILRRRIYEIKPQLVVCGHIHEGYGHVEEDGILYVNASMMNREYRLANQPILLEYDIAKGTYRLG